MGRLDICFRAEAPTPGIDVVGKNGLDISDGTLQAIIPFVPTENPTLGHLVYEMILAYFLSHDRQVSISERKLF